MGQAKRPEGPENTSVKGKESLQGSEGIQSEMALLPPWSQSQKPPEPGPRCCRKLTAFLRRVTRTHLLAVIAVLIVTVAVLAVSLAVLKGSQCSERPQTKGAQSNATSDGKDGAVLPPCGDDWIWYRNKCFYFSEAEGTWTEAKDSCAALNSSLALIDTQKEMSFMMRYKGAADHWIGLKRDSSEQPWKWVDGTLFNQSFTVEDFSECAYLNERTVRSAGCGRIRHWTCTKVAPYERKRTKRTLNSQLFH